MRAQAGYIDAPIRVRRYQPRRASEDDPFQLRQYGLAAYRLRSPSLMRARLALVHGFLSPSPPSRSGLLALCKAHVINNAACHTEGYEIYALLGTSFAPSIHRMGTCLSSQLLFINSQASYLDHTDRFLFPASSLRITNDIIVRNYTLSS